MTPSIARLRERKRQSRLRCKEPVLNSHVTEQLLDRKRDIAQDRPQETWTDRLAGMCWNHRSSSVGVSKESVTAFCADYFETCPFQNANDLLTLEPGKASHIEIC